MVPLEVVVSNHNVICPVAMGAAASPEPIRSVGNNGHMWPPLPLMSLQSKIIDSRWTSIVHTNCALSGHRSHRNRSAELCRSRQ